MWSPLDVSFIDPEREGGSQNALSAIGRSLLIYNFFPKIKRRSKMDSIVGQSDSLRSIPVSRFYKLDLQERYATSSPFLRLL